MPRARRESAEDERIVRTMAEALAIEEYLDQPVGPLPYGIRKKVEIARALCAEPSLLLLDEPVAGMNDAESRILGEQ
ncbi:ATP-binding cassette domain-containing protein, partial [Prescottella defluvii]|uniref:ATP-binding cassette domain-containing protein n=1 Tax=Prescottella defluvii TaxID=1323361 RepID=UPI0022AF852D